MRIPERFFRQPSIARGVSLELFLDKNPEIKEYLELTRQVSLQAQGGAAGQLFSTIPELVQFLMDSNVPHRFVKNAHMTFRQLPCAGLSSGQDSVEGAHPDERNQDKVKSAEVKAKSQEVKAESPKVTSPPEKSRFSDAKNFLQRILGNHKTDKSERMKEQDPLVIEVVTTEEVPAELPGLNSPGRASRPESLDLMALDTDRMSVSSDSTLTPTSQFYFYLLNTHLSPNESLV